MPAIRNIPQRYSITLFVFLVIALGWGRFALDWIGQGGSDAGLFIGAATIGGLLVAFLTGGRQELMNLLRRCLRWRVGFKWWALALLIPPATYLVAIAIHVMLGGSMPGFSLLINEWHLIPLLIAIVLTPGDGPLGEIGCRGFLLPLMQSKWGPLAASVIIGVFYSLWHLPEFLEEGSFQHLMGMPFLFWFTLGGVGNAAVMTWLYNKTGGSALVGGIVFHGSMNFWAMTLLIDLSLTSNADLAPFDLELLTIATVCMALAGALIVLLTRGRLGVEDKSAGVNSD